MKILITGGDGFIARNLCEQMHNNHAVTAPNKSKLDLLDSVKVFEYIKNNPFDVVIHAATYDAAPINSTKDPGKVLEYNLSMFFNLARCHNYFGKMIYFGSGAEFGRPFWQPRMNENYFDQHIPADPYGLSKYIMTQHAQRSRNIYNLRLFGVFGKYDDWRYRFIPNACSKAALGLPITFKQNKIFDFLYVDDLVKIVQWFVGHDPKQHVYNVCSGQSYEFKALAQKVLKAASKNLDIIVKTEGRGTEYSGDNTLLLNEIKGFKFSAIDDSIQHLYRWYDANKQLIKKEEFHY